MAIDYGVLQAQIAEHGKDSAVVATMLQMLGTTLEVAEKRIENQSGKIERDRKRKLEEKLAESMSAELNDMVSVDNVLKSARDWAIIAHDRLETAKSLRAKAKPITLALDDFRIGKIAELVADGRAPADTAFAFKVVKGEDGSMIVTWKPKGSRGGGGGQPNGHCIFALDGTLLESGQALYLEIVGKVYSGSSSAAKAACTAADKSFDWKRVSYADGVGSPYVRADLAAAGAIAVEGLGKDD